MSRRTNPTRNPTPRSLPYFGAAAAGVVGLMVAPLGSRLALKRYQTARMRALLRHSYETVPFYRRRFDEADFHPDRFRSLEDLWRVPITRKSDLQVTSASDAIACDCDRDRLHRYGTGGSTGSPVEARFTRFEDRLLRMFRLQATMRYGFRLRDRRSTLSVCHLGPAGKIRGFGILRSQTLRAYEPQAELRAALRQFRPDVIRGYPSVLASLATQLTAGDRMHIRPRFITTDSEVLTDLARTQIEKAFRAPVFDIYDCFECNVIATQCRCGSTYHVMDTSVLVEVLDGNQSAPAGCPGEIAITSLHAWAAPLIRYVPGDIVEQGPDECSCGAPNTVLGTILGRTRDRFLMPDGRVLNPKLLAAWIYPLCSVLRQYQIAQETSDRVVVRLQLVPGETIASDKLQTLRQGIIHSLGDGVTVRIDIVDAIPREPNGKFRPYRCYLDSHGTRSTFV